MVASVESVAFLGWGCSMSQRPVLWGPEGAQREQGRGME